MKRRIKICFQNIWRRVQAEDTQKSFLEMTNQIKKCLKNLETTI